LIAVSGTGATQVTDTAYGHIVTNGDMTEQVVTAKTNTEKAVREYFSDIPVMIQVARCESAFRHTLEDGTVLKGKVDGRDTGVMQINSFYHSKAAAELGLNLSDLEDNMAYARHLYETQGIQPWSASSSCWGATLASL
jgi:hypothetical protein